MPGERRTVEYEISDGATRHRLEDVGWADWDSSGRLLVATTDGRIQIRDGDPATLHVEHEVDLSELAPTPAEPPSEARTW
jgi:16S rRNA U516 pseudouridylate synthase RsuA-like enzyme